MENFTDILFKTTNNLGIATLNRPQALNALNLGMTEHLYMQLKKWADDPTIKAVIINSASEKAFCAGGDLKAIYFHKHETSKGLIAIFWHEYRLNHLIYHYPKPFVALLDGITMGGGAGISIYGNHRVGTEKFVFAMPETKIGFYPDIGASYFLSRLPAKIGIYLGLTGKHIQAADALYLGLLDYYIESQHILTLTNELIKTDLTKSTVDDVIKKYAGNPGLAPIKQYQAIIENCFSFDTVEDIVKALEKHANPWTASVADQLKKLSPTSLKVTLEQLKKGSMLNFDECLKMEYGMTYHFLNNKDLYEGIRAVVIDKDNQPKWQPAKLSEVTLKDIESYFLPLTKEAQLKFN